jgi:hypothetical protein
VKEAVAEGVGETDVVGLCEAVEEREGESDEVKDSVAGGEAEVDADTEGDGEVDTAAVNEGDKELVDVPEID